MLILRRLQTAADEECLVSLSDTEWECKPGPQNVVTL